MKPLLTLIVVSGLALPALLLAADTNSVLAPGAKLEKLAGDFKFTEGPTCDKNGNVFFTDQPNNRILKWSVDGKLSTFMQPAGRANGMFFDAQGNLIACADEKTELWSITPDGKHTVLAKEFEGKALNGPNDVWVRADGSLYFTDPFYKRPWWDYNQPPQGTEQVYFLSADRKTLKRVTTDLVQPNGIIGTPDGKKLFVADIKASKTYAFDIQTDGSLANKRLHCELGSDGMTLDEAGNLYLTGKGVTVFDKTGKQIERIAVPENWTANVCFGGKDYKTLFITASTGLYSIHTKYRGAEFQAESTTVLGKLWEEWQPTPEPSTLEEHYWLAGLWECSSREHRRLNRDVPAEERDYDRFRYMKVESSRWCSMTVTNSPLHQNFCTDFLRSEKAGQLKQTLWPGPLSYYHPHFTLGSPMQCDCFFMRRNPRNLTNEFLLKHEGAGDLLLLKRAPLSIWEDATEEK